MSTSTQVSLKPFEGTSAHESYFFIVLIKPHDIKETNKLRTIDNSYNGLRFFIQS